MVIDYLALYQRQPTKLPRLQLSWSVSRRTLHKMKPSTRAAQDLEPIMEDEDASNLSSGSDDGDESSIFDRFADLTLLLRFTYNVHGNNLANLQYCSVLSVWK